MRAATIAVDGTVTYDELTFEQCQEAVGGDVELVSMTPTVCGYVNEQGKLLDLPPNPIATKLCRSLKDGFTDVILGVMVVTGPRGEEDITPAGFAAVAGQEHIIAEPLHETPVPDDGRRGPGQGPT